MRVKMSKIKAPIAGTIGKIGNAEIGHFGRMVASHELIRGSLTLALHFSPPFDGDGPMARPGWLSLGRRARHRVGDACALLGRESHRGHTLAPSRDERG